MARRLEAAAHLTPSPVTTPRSLAYRILAQVLAARVADTHAWALTRDGVPVLVVDVHGSAYTRTGRVLDLWGTFRATGRHLHRTVAARVVPVIP